MVPFAGLLAALEGIPDPRRRQGRRYPLAHLLLFSVLAVLAGATSYRGILTFIGVHRERLNAVFGARLRRAPAVNTLRGLFLALEAAELEAAFREHARALADRTPASGPRVIALDGQTLRRSFDHLNDEEAAGRGAGGERARGKAARAHLQSPERGGGRAGAGRLRGRARVDPAPQGDHGGRRGRGGRGADRGGGLGGRPFPRRCPALPKKP